MSGYCTGQDLVSRFGLDRVLERADRDGDGTPDADVIGMAIADAGAEIDGYLAARYPLPLATVPELLVRVASTLAFATLFGAEAPEGVRALRTDAVRILQDLASGRVTLGGPDVAAPASRLEVAASAPVAVFDAKTLRGF
ncbi:MAG: DUF1320 domain-containing protein [Magnetococcales bacterium]|nr:DUF1320 domain-containing protein [Magnetococcales bacterium]